MKRHQPAGRPSRVVRELPVEWVGKKSYLKDLLYSAIHGADEIVRSKKIKDPSKVKTVSGFLVTPYGKGGTAYKGSEGGVLHNITQKSLDKLQSKKLEQVELAKYFPKGAIETLALNKRHAGNGFKKVHNKFVSKGKKYFVKAHQSEDTGVGGVGFINSEDMKKFYSGPKGRSRLSSSKKEEIKHLLENPDQYIVQPDIGIKKSITGANREFRVHAIDGKVIPGASTIRASNIEDLPNVEKIEKFYQEYLDSLPNTVRRKNLGHAADVALTEKGPKIIETNTGFASGFLDPIDLWDRFRDKNPLKGGIASGLGIRRNLNVYKHITGREHAVPAALKSLGVSGLTYGGGRYIEKKMDGEKKP